jgi:hypothetical protein
MVPSNIPINAPQIIAIRISVFIMAVGVLARHLERSVRILENTLDYAK